MAKSQKVWVIDVDHLRDRVRGGDKGSPSGQTPERLRLHAGAERDHTGRLFWGAYLFGPLAPVVMRQGRGSMVWAAFGLLGMFSWGTMLWRWSDVAYRLENGQIPFSLWCIGAGLAFLAVVLGWARALWLAGSDTRFFADRVPRWLASPLPAGVLGLVMPGAGLLLVGAPRRAALGLLGFSTFLVSLATLWKSQWLWKLNAVLPSGALLPRDLEMLFLAAAGLAFLGGMIWIASVLDGMRCGFRRQGGPRTALGDWMTFLLLITVLAAYFSSEPTSVARDIHDYAQALRHEGMRVVPLQLARLAHKVDPSRPRYAVHLATLLQENGDVAEAEILRGQLRASWREYEQLMAPEAESLHDSPRAAPAENTALVLPSPPTSAGSAALLQDSLGVPPVADSLLGPATPVDSLQPDSTAVPAPAP